MRNAHRLREQIAAGWALLGAEVTLVDPIVSEVLARTLLQRSGGLTHSRHWWRILDGKHIVPLLGYNLGLLDD